MADKDLRSIQHARDAVESASLAFRSLSAFSQSKVDEICEKMSRAALAESARLGLMAHEETGFGRPDDKREKNRFAAEDVWDRFRHLRTVGKLNDSPSIVEIGSPRGVVAAIIPSTNPTSTAIFKILIAIKSCNSIVLSPHPSAINCIAETARIMAEEGIRAGLPENAIVCLTETSIDGTEELMKHRQTAVILATGGTGLVRAAYSSGKPAFGVGPGNVPVFIDRSADITKAVADILTGTCFDNGTICASEQSVVVDRSIAAEVRRQFIAQGGYFLNPSEAESVAGVLVTSSRSLNPKIVGKSAEFIAGLAGVSVPPGTRCLLADCEGVGRDFPWSIEKLSPTLAFFEVDSVDEGAEVCRKVLNFGGMGHTAGMHSRDRNAAIRYGELMPAARIVINSPTTHGAIGFTTDLPPSMTLGCGSWGGNVTSDNISPLHLIDVKRIAFETKPLNRQLPADHAASSRSDKKPEAAAPKKLDRKDIESLVDSFLLRKLATKRASAPSPGPVSKNVAAPPTIVHEVNEKNSEQNRDRPKPVDFVSEEDVRRAIEKGEKIYISSKTIVTPSARDLGEEREVFARI